MRALILPALLACLASAAAQPPAGSACLIRTPGLDFRPYRALDPFPNIAIGRIGVDCRGSTAGVLRVTISSGRSGNPIDRRLSQGSHLLRYNLYADPARRLVAGDGSAGTVALVPLLRRLGGRNIFRIFGVIPPRQAVPAGDYADYLRVVVEF